MLGLILFIALEEDLVADCGGPSTWRYEGQAL